MNPETGTGRPGLFSLLAPETPGADLLLKICKSLSSSKIRRGSCTTRSGQSQVLQLREDSNFRVWAVSDIKASDSYATRPHRDLQDLTSAGWVLWNKGKSGFIVVFCCCSFATAAEFAAYCWACGLCLLLRQRACRLSIVRAGRLLFLLGQGSVFLVAAISPESSAKTNSIQKQQVASAQYDKQELYSEEQHKE